MIDMTKVKAGDDLHHSKFAESPEIVQLIGSRLSDGQTLTDTRVGLGDHIVAANAEAAHTIGTAAGLVVSAPVAVIDQNTRQNYGHHVETLLGSSGQATPIADPHCNGNQARVANCSRQPRYKSNSRKCLVNLQCSSMI